MSAYYALQDFKMNYLLCGLLLLIVDIRYGSSLAEAPVLKPLIVPTNIELEDITELYCSVKRGSSPLQFRWLHKGKDISSHPKYRVTSSETSSNFLIGKIQASDIGNFTCIASNEHGTDQKTESVIIEGITKRTTHA